MNKMAQGSEPVNRGRQLSVNPGPVIACEYPVSPRPNFEPHAVTPAQAARLQLACEDTTSALAVVVGVESGQHTARPLAGQNARCEPNSTN